MQQAVHGARSGRVLLPFLFTDAQSRAGSLPERAIIVERYNADSVEPVKEEFNRMSCPGPSVVCVQDVKIAVTHHIPSDLVMAAGVRQDLRREIPMTITVEYAQPVLR
jgi:hypothetical protein